MLSRAEQLARAAVATTAEQTKKKASPTGFVIQGTRRCHCTGQSLRISPLLTKYYYKVWKDVSKK